MLCKYSFISHETHNKVVMKLPPSAPAAEYFQNAPGSKVPEVYALEARRNPDNIKEMAETPAEIKELQSEALVRQYVIIVDRSGSMGGPDGYGTRWDSARLAVEKMIEKIFLYDVDHKVPLYLFDNYVEFVGEVTSSAQVMRVFKDYQPRGTTGLAGVLNEALETYAGTKRPNYKVIPGTTFIVLLDGGADDEEAVYDTIKRFANPANGYIENHTQIAISFVQIGDNEAATRFLKKLDDDFQPDICDTAKDDILNEHGGLDRLLYNAIFD